MSHGRYPLPSIAIALVIAAACGGTEPSNAPPVAAFTATCEQFECVFENSSEDHDGSISSVVWDFGDGESSTDARPTHSYAAPGGEFNVTVAVTDDDGAAATASRQVTVGGSEINGAPAAAFSASCAELECTFTDLSTDPDPGDSVASRFWDFGDADSSSERVAHHTYSAPGGQFDVNLIVTDLHGDTGRITKTVSAIVTTGDIYERVSPHSEPGRRSRYLIRSDGTFAYIEEGSAGSRTLGGRWTTIGSWNGYPLPPSYGVYLDFDDLSDTVGCGGEGFGLFLVDGILGVNYCYAPIMLAGLEEGVYARTPIQDIPNTPPPQVGQIAFVRDGKIHLVNTDGTGMLSLTSGPSDFSPAWSADGSRIAFSRGGAAPGIYVMTSTDWEPVRLSTAGEYPTWSPDGEWIAFSCSEGLCKVRPSGDGPPATTLFPRPGRTQHPAWSPDGARIAYSSDWMMYDFWFDLWTLSLDPLEATVLRYHNATTPNPDEQYQPAWSPDGQRLAVVECPWAFNFCSSSAIAVMNADGSGLVRIAAASGFARPTWSPDGQAIAFASASTPGSIDWVSVDGLQRGRIIANGASPAWRP